MASIHRLSEGTAEIPEELRLMIYEDVLVSSHPLRPLHEPRRANEPRAPRENIFNISLLLANRQIFPGAKQFFYAHNVFTFTILPHGLFDLRPNRSHPNRPNYLVNIPLMTRISMSYSSYGVHIRENENIADYLQYVVRNCPSLRTITLLIRGQTPLSLICSPRQFFERHSGIEQKNPAGVRYNTGQMLAQLLQSPKLERLTFIMPVSEGEEKGHPFFAAPHIQWLTEDEGRGDEYCDIPGTVLAAARESMGANEELRHWTCRPAEEKEEKRRREQAEREASRD